MLAIVLPTEHVGTGLFGPGFGCSEGLDEGSCIKIDTYSNKNAAKPFRGSQMRKEIQIYEIVVECYFFRVLSSIMQRAVNVRAWYECETPETSETSE